jgi:hypothetical protein
MLKIDEIGNVHDRIDQLVDHFYKGNKAAFGRGADIQSGVLAGIIGGRKNKPSFDVLQKLLTAYPSVNPTWLLFGRGPMLHDEVVEATEITTGTLQSKELEEMVYQIVKNQLDERGRQSEFRVKDWKKKLTDKLNILHTNIETNKKMMAPSIVDRARYTIVAGKEFKEKLTNELLTKEIQQYEEEARSVRAELSEFDRFNEQFKQERYAAVYRLTGEPDYEKSFWGMLHLRLSIPAEVAEKLVVSGKIRSVEIEGEGYRVTEQAVREFLGEA